MFARTRLAWIGCLVLLSAGVLAAQTVIAPPKTAVPPAPGHDVVAVRVNGQPVFELAAYRSLVAEPHRRAAFERMTPQQREEARRSVLSFLIDNTIIDQYLIQLKLVVDNKEVEESILKIKKQASDERKDFKKMLAELMITEDELRTELTGALRWDKFVIQQGTDKVLLAFFKANPDMFNGCEVHARHILMPASAGTKEEIIAKLAAIKRQIEADVASAQAKIPPTTDAVMREKERNKAIEKAFGDAAMQHSTCPSKKDGGNLGSFPRVGAMVEPFSQVAFALKPYQISDPVATEFGYHLILAIDRKPGKDVKFEDKKAFVQEVYGERLREAVLNAYKPRAKIEFTDRK